MRIVTLFALPLLMTGCSHFVDSNSQQTPTNSSTTTSSTVTVATGKPPVATTAPVAGTHISDVIAWIEKGQPADPARYHSATREGTTTQLGDNIAFTAPSGSGSPAVCMTDSKHTGTTMSCLLQLTSPPPRPATVYGAWKGGWVDFDGTRLQIGSAHADPGPFSYGEGPALAAGYVLSFSDYRCRADQAGLFCVNYAHQSAVRFSAAGVEPFGCLRPVPAPEDAGIVFNC